MTRITTFQIPLRVEELRPPIFAGAVVTPLAEPMQALVTAISRRAAEAPFSIYLCADDDTTRTRDDFAIALARTLAAHIPSTLVVDCDFLRPGLSGLVPQKDALGFLDYMLYGSSIGVITQDDDRVHMVGAGSFPVTRRMPFVEAAFVDAARRLVAHARCVVFVGPAFDGDGGRHPLTTTVDVVATLRTTLRHPRLDTAEESIGSAGPEVWSVRMADAAVVERPVAPPPPPATPRQPVREPELPSPRAVPTPRAQAPVAPPGAPMPEPALERGPSALAPRIAVMVFGLLVIGFVVWWFMQNRELPHFGEQNASPGTVATDTTARARPDTVVTAPAPAETPSRTQTAPPPKPAVVEPETLAPPIDPGTAERSAGTTRLINSEDIQLMEDLVRRFNGWFIIHISSFQTSARAREEVAFLESRDYPAFIVFLDLGPKGKWYRIYSGPFQTRVEASEVKKNLDTIPQVRFTRIASIPD